VTGKRHDHSLHVQNEKRENLLGVRRGEATDDAIRMICTCSSCVESDLAVSTISECSVYFRSLNIDSANEMFSGDVLRAHLASANCTRMSVSIDLGHTYLGLHDHAV
jgi:hypothetical protein